MKLPTTGSSCIDINLNVGNSSVLHEDFSILYRIQNGISAIGLIIIFAPCFIYSFCFLVVGCVRRFKKQPKFHDEMIKPLIERYHDTIMN